MPISLEGGFREPLYARVAARALAGISEGSVSVPHGYIYFHRRACELVVDGGLFVVSDYGTVRREQLRGHPEVRPHYYGDSVNQDVSFAVFEDYAAETGGSALVSGEPLRSVHTALLSASPLPERTRRAFAE